MALVQYVNFCEIAICIWKTAIYRLLLAFLKNVNANWLCIWLDFSQLGSFESVENAVSSKTKCSTSYVTILESNDRIYVINVNKYYRPDLFLDFFLFIFKTMAFQKLDQSLMCTVMCLKCLKMIDTIRFCKFNYSCCWA